MKKQISTWWPVAIFLPIALAFCVQTSEGNFGAKRSEQIGVDGVSAELARGISFGLVDTKNAKSASPLTAPKSFWPSARWSRARRNGPPEGDHFHLFDASENHPVVYFSTAATAFATTSRLRVLSAATQMRPVFTA